MPRMPEPLNGPLRLCGVLSSHVGDEKRLKRLEHCFDSIAQQTQALAGFFVVWSSPESLAPKVEALLASLQEHVHVKTLRQDRRTSQFYDIRWLYQEYISKEPPNTWLLFSDDDDLWGPERVRLYGAVVDRHGRQPGVTGVCATHKVRPKHRTDVATSASMVEQQLAKGAAMHCGGVHQEEEFFDFACPTGSLGAFLEICNDETLLHPFCDLRFTRFLQEYYEGGKVMYFPTDQTNPWVYYYSTAYRSPEDAATYEQFVKQDQASTVVRSRKEDRMRAEELCKKMGGAYWGKAERGPDKEELDEMTDFVAALRQNIEAILIRHFPETPMKTGEMKRIAVGQASGASHRDEREVPGAQILPTTDSLSHHKNLWGSNHFKIFESFRFVMLMAIL
ncbi:unnamed protein product [Durusdinium trenchii]|uniref:Uncharacterized protein n=1 Tax=Durusdinium trenchii TaxID=1381693 RepID=A0ABP0R8C1_9DINO